MSSRTPSGREPLQSREVEYRHAHQDVRMGGRAAASSDLRTQEAERQVQAIFQALDRAPARTTTISIKSDRRISTKIKPSSSIVTLKGDARLPASTSQIDNAVTTRPAEPDFTKAFPPPPKPGLKDKAIEIAGNLADRYVMGRSQIHRAVRGKPSSVQEIRAEIAVAESLAAWEAKYRALEAVFMKARDLVSKDPSLGNVYALTGAEKDVRDFLFADDSAWSIPTHARHTDWKIARAQRSAEAAKNIDEMAEVFDRVLSNQTGDIEHVFPKHPDLPTALYAATSREPSILAKAVAGAYDRAPIEILADVGITAEPVGVVENFTDIWCVFVDRDQLDFIGTNRNESRVEIALTLHAAFQTMIRMSGFSEEVLEASGINLDDPCLETLATFLNARTNDHYSFGPYETSIDERLFNFLQ